MSAPEAQFFVLSASHLAIVALVIVACQMQDSVQRENFDFFGGGVSECARILAAISAEIAMSPANRAASGPAGPETTRRQWPDSCRGTPVKLAQLRIARSRAH